MTSLAPSVSHQRHLQELGLVDTAPATDGIWGTTTFTSVGSSTYIVPSGVSLVSVVAVGSASSVTSAASSGSRVVPKSGC